MSSITAVRVPAYPYDESQEVGAFSGFAPGTRVLPAGLVTAR
jgi:hypothetical protein